MSEEVKLKPCSYCGSAPRIEHHFSQDEYRYCCCSNPSCPSNLPSLTDEIAYENWNTRLIEDELQAKIDELTKERDGYKAKLDFINSERYQEFQKERKEIKERHEKLRKRLDY